MMKDIQNTIVYKSNTGAIELQKDIKSDTVWASQKQIADIFGVAIPTINEHVRNIYKIDELKKDSTIRKFRIVQKEGSRSVNRSVDHYNLDMILSVGYRVNSKTATKFRQWATQTLRQHITDGFTINPARIKNNYDQFLNAIDEVKLLLPEDAESSNLSSKETLDLINLFAQTWLSLDAYDKSELPESGSSKSEIMFTADDLQSAISELKQNLIEKNEATDLFAQEKHKETLKGIVQNIFQSAFGEDAYSTIEEKAAHLLYFIIKDHPFNDGNKRSAAFSFIWFLQKAGLLNTNHISPEALTALTILIAESSPKDKGRMIGLMLLLLQKK